MARLGIVLAAVAKASNRGSKSFRQVSGNNMFYAGLTLAAMTDIQALAFFAILIAIVLFLPSSSDPMTVAPRERLELWPLQSMDRRLLRVISPLLNPLTWLILGALVWRRVTWGLWAFVFGFFLAGFLGSWWIETPRIWFPRIVPPLLRKDLRQFLTALDFYCALLIAVPAAYFRFVSGELPADAHVPLTMLLVVIPSTMALTLFGLDTDGGLVRYGLLPLPGWKVLLSKGLSYLLLVWLVTLPLSPSGGIAGGLMALAIGQWYATKRMIPQLRWRFRASNPFGASLGQMLGALAGFALVTQLGPAWLAFCAAVYGGSVWITGRRLDRLRATVG